MGLNNILTAAIIRRADRSLNYIPMWKGLTSGGQYIRQRTVYLSPSTDRIQRHEEVWRQSVFRCGHGYDHGSPGFVKCLSDRHLAQAPVWDIFGFQHSAAIGYQGTVLPVLAISWILAQY